MNGTDSPFNPSSAATLPNGHRLLPRHLDDLHGSGLADDQIRAAGLYSVENQAEVRELLGWRISDVGPCLAFPFFDPGGSPLGYGRLTPDRTRTEKKEDKDKEKAVKYESPAGRPNRLYLPPGTRAALADPTRAILITEGEKKSLKADQEGFPCLGLVGIYGWCRKRKEGESP